MDTNTDRIEIEKIEKPTASLSYWKLVWRQFCKNRLNKFGFVIIFFTFLIALFASFLANDRPLYVKIENKTYFPILKEIFLTKYFVKYSDLPNEEVFQQWKTIRPANTKLIWPPIPYSPTQYDLDFILTAPSKAHWLGTDEQGRDVASRLIYGSQISLSVGFIAVGIYVLIGIFLGACAGYFGGTMDLFLSRLTEIMICFPTFFLILVVLAFVGPSL